MVIATLDATSAGLSSSLVKLAGSLETSISRTALSLRTTIEPFEVSNPPSPSGMPSGRRLWVVPSASN
jgi:hypothetical protein